MIVCFGTYDAARHPRVQVLIEGLRGDGREVVELNRPLRLTTAERVRTLQRPWLLPRLLMMLVSCWIGLVRDAVRLRRRPSRRPEAVLVGYMGHFDVLLARVLFPRTRLVLDHLIFAGDTAADRGAKGARVRLLRVLDRLSTSVADLVVTDTEEHRLMLRAPERGVVVPVGAPEAWFDVAPVAARNGALRVVFFGLFTPLQGVMVTAEAVARLAKDGVDVEVTMIGTGQDYDGARRLLDGEPRVTWLDWAEPEQLPALVASHDVCLGIFSDTPKGRRVVPNKVYQGIAAGCVVVTSDTAPQRRAVGDWVELVPPADPVALADRLAQLGEADALAAARARARAGRAAVTPRTVVRPLVDSLTTRSVPR